MIVYTVHEPTPPARDVQERAEGVMFIKEGFTWGGLLVPPLWLLANRLWFETIALLVSMGVGAYALMSIGLGENGAVVANLAAGLLIGFEGNNLKRWKLERRNYAFLGSVAGRDFEECERRFFDMWLPQISGTTPVQPASGKRLIMPGQDWDTPSTVGLLPGAVT